jgi:hypothetical protein
MVEPVTVIVNSYNEDETLFRRALSSIVRANPLQIILNTVKGDNCIVWSRDYPITLLVVDRPGIYTQLNNCLPYIEGEYVCYASSNDVMLPHKLALEVSILRKNPTKKVCNSFFITHDCRKSKPFVNRLPLKYDYNRHLVGNFISDCSLVESSVFLKHTPFNLATGNHGYWDLWLRIFHSLGDVFITNTTPTWEYHRTWESQSLKRSKNRDKINQNQREYEILRKLYPQKVFLKNPVQTLPKSSATDIVIPYVKSTNSKLHLVLNSIKQNAKFEHRVIVIGDNPNLPGVIHIPKPRVETRTHIKLKDAWNKLHHVIKEPNISSNFILTYDDIYWNQPISLEFFNRKIALTHGPKQIPKNKVTTWASHLYKTINWLHEHGNTFFNYETHIPRLFNKSKLRNLVNSEAYYRNMLLVSTWYFNYYFSNTQPEFITKASKIKAGFYGSTNGFSYGPENDVEEVCKDALFINHNRAGLFERLENYLNQKFNAKTNIPVY